MGRGDTAATVASKLASAINATAGSVVTAATPNVANAGLVNLLSTATGASTDYAVSVSVSDSAAAQYPYFLANPSFSAVAGSMFGGANADASYAPIYSYHAGYAPNGNIMSHTDSVMGEWSFSYDAVDRLAAATAVGDNPAWYASKFGCWSYDAFGNRTEEDFSTGACDNSPTPQVVTSYNPAHYCPAISRTDSVG